MHRLNKQYSVRPDHVSAVGEVYPVPNRGAFHAYDVFLIGGQTITVSGSKEDMYNSLTAIIREIDMIDGAPA
ncbi:hypothetical protein SRABI102_01562 [Stenotrophomonas lactitubi]|nr:hypothetical protein SRABI81_01305 [Stenotrophomonas lactitubi]CAH0174784.1 hypothetical protein SRABI122_01273 [Stenotrophomonas lactitubi]CAH0192929.1 hypothetical protein SRABI102_01562 [Stenotrophomonas lactitubi]CAH0227431.1 hypothetical protein SRABI66_02601 [Stenotrophomonas lactitubi]